MSRKWHPLVAALLAASATWACGQVAPAPAAPRVSLQAAVNASVEKGVQWLRAQQGPDGHWHHGHFDTNPMGVTALCALALVRSDVKPDDPAILRSLDALTYKAFEKTYDTGLLLMLLEAVKTVKRHDEWARRGAEFLVVNQQASGLWAYPAGTPDLSNSQFAVFGLFAASRLGVTPPKGVVEKIVAWLLTNQKADGSFAYVASAAGRGSMSGAGIASLLLARQLDDKFKLGLPRKAMDQACDRAFEWLGRRFSAERHPDGTTDGYLPNEGFFYYYLYAVERAAVLGGRPRLGPHDWYQEGALHLIRAQSDEGHWGDVEQTSMALLFLKRASLTYSPHADAMATDPKQLIPADSRPVDLALRSVRVAPDVPFLRSWLVLGPIPNPDDKALAEDFIKEAKVLPAAGAQSGKLVWKEWKSDTDAVDLDAAISPQPNVVGYACCYLWSEQDQDGILWFGSDEGGRVMLNRELIVDEHRHDQTGPDSTRVRIHLKKGRNVLVCKIEELGYYWRLHVRVSDPEGRVLPIKPSLKSER